jgi:hypothetical protein
MTCARCGGSSFATWRPNPLQSLSQEAVRDEALEEAAKICDAIAYSRECADDTMQGVYDARPYKQCATTIRALKREPNAAAEEDSGEIAHAMSMTDDGPERPPSGEMATLRVFKPCEKHKNVTSWTVHPTNYAIPAKEVCPVCEEIAYNQRSAAEAEGRKG